MRTALSLILVLALAVSAAAQTVVSPIAHLSRAEGTLYVGAGNNQITTLLSSANGRSLISAADYAAMKALLAYGTMADQAANSVAITGGTINGTTIGGTTPGAGTFSSLSLGDAAKLQMGDSGATDSYINYTGSYLAQYGLGGIRFDPYVSVGTEGNSLYPMRVGAEKSGTSLSTLYANTFLQIVNASTTTNSLTAIQYGGYNTSSSAIVTAAIAARLTDRTAGTVDGDLIFLTTRNDTVTHAMSIKSTGDIGIEEESPDYNLDVNGTFGFTPDTDSVPIDNGDVTIDFPTATTLRLRGKNGGTVRNLTLPITDAALTDGQVLKVSSGTPTWAADTDTLGSIGSVANGDIAIYNSGWTRLAKGTENQVLKMGAALPAWGADNNTEYSAGDGLDLTGTDFDLDLKSGGGLEIESGELRLSTHEAAATQAGSGATAMLDFSANAIIKFTFDDNDGDTTFMFTDPPAGSRCILILIQDADGGETVTWPVGETIYWAGGTAPTLSTGASERDVITLLFDGTDYYCTGYAYATL